MHGREGGGIVGDHSWGMDVVCVGGHVWEMGIWHRVMRYIIEIRNVENTTC